MDSFSLDFAPLIPILMLLFLFTIIVAGLFFGLIRKARGVWFRTISLLLILLLLANPSILKEQREPIKSKVLIIVDKTSSQQIADREEKTNNIVESLEQQLNKFETIDAVIVPVFDRNDETKLWSVMEEAASDIEKDVLSGVIIVTDGQIHDLPSDNFSALFNDIPVHSILTGSKTEKDISVLVTQAPRYSLVGEEIKISVRIDVHGSQALKDKTYQMQVMQNGKITGNMNVTSGNVQSFKFKLDRAGDAVFSFSVAPIEGEITVANNTAVAVVKSVRDRLRVLLVSGMPHAGERTWRNLLKSDPAVDLVHFTILRSPMSLDMTPSRELSLIAFPVNELFQRKLKKFDLVIFDRYHMQGVLQDYYLRNIRNYVREGGALLIAAGPEYVSGRSSLYSTALKDILPARPFSKEKGNILAGFIPELTEIGHVHPVTELFDNKKRKWGRWFRQIGVKKVSATAHVLMSGANDLPLLMLDEVEKGRVAFLGSDQIWLWTRGFETGGPQRELLRRLVHWLMKEPDLEANRLSVKVIDKKITVRRKSLLNVDEDIEITMINPLGESKELILTRELKRRWQKAEINVDDFGLYRFDDEKSKQTGFAVVGRIDIPELQQVVTTENKIKPYINGGVSWFSSQENIPLLKHKSNFGLRNHGDNWFGIKKNSAYRVVGLKNYSLLSVYWFMLLSLIMVVLAWIKESKS